MRQADTFLEFGRYFIEFGRYIKHNVDEPKPWFWFGITVFLLGIGLQAARYLKKRKAWKERKAAFHPKE